MLKKIFGTVFVIILITNCDAIGSELAEGFLIGPESQAYLEHVRKEPYSGYTQEIPLLDSPNGKKFGTLHIQLAGHDVYVSTLTIDGQKIKLSETDIEMEGSKTMKQYLKYWEQTNGFVRVLEDSYDKDIWIDLVNNPGLTWQPLTYAESITRCDKWTIEGYHGYRLKKAPSLSSDIIIILDKDKHIIKSFTKKIKGSWAEAIIYETTEPMFGMYFDKDLDEKWTGNKWTGWIMILDQHGMPKDITCYQY